MLPIDGSFYLYRPLKKGSRWELSIAAIIGSQPHNHQLNLVTAGLATRGDKMMHPLNNQ